MTFVLENDEEDNSESFIQLIREMLKKMNIDPDSIIIKPCTAEIDFESGTIIWDIGTIIWEPGNEEIP